MGIICKYLWGSACSIYHSLTFYFGNNEDFANSMESAYVNTSNYPDGIFNDVTKWIFMTIISVGFSSYMPIEVITKGNYILIAIILCFAIAISLFAYIIFNKKLKRYNSGNLMMSRI